MSAENLFSHPILIWCTPLVVSSTSPSHPQPALNHRIGLTRPYKQGSKMFRWRAEKISVVFLQSSRKPELVLPLTSPNSSVFISKYLPHQFPGPISLLHSQKRYSTSTRFQQFGLPTVPGPCRPCTFHLIWDLHGSCAAARIQLKQQPQGLLSQPQSHVPHQQHHQVSFGHKGPRRDIVLTSHTCNTCKMILLSISPKRKFVPTEYNLKQGKKQQHDSRKDWLSVLEFPVLIAEFPAITSRTIIYKSGKFVNR